MTQKKHSTSNFDIRNFTPYLLNMAAEETSDKFSSVYKNRYGMTRTEWRVLFHLGRYGRMNANEIGRRSKIHKTKISRAVRALEEKRFLSRELSDEDRRVEYLELRKDGQDAYKVLVSHAEEYERHLEEKLGRDQVLALKETLKTLAMIE